MSYVWKQEELAKAAELWNAGVGARKIAEALGRTVQATEWKIGSLVRVGVLPRHEPKAFPYTQAQDDEIMRRWAAGERGAVIAEAVGLTARQVYNRVTKYRLEARKRSVQSVKKQAGELVPFAGITALVLDAYKVPFSTVTSMARRRKIVEARQVLMCLGYRHTKLSLTQIGDRIKRDHTTVLHGVKLAPVKYPAALERLEAALFHSEAAE